MADLLANEYVMSVIGILATLGAALLAWRNWRAGDTESRADMIERLVLDAERRYIGRGQGYQKLCYVIAQLTQRFGEDQRPALIQEVEKIVDELNAEERAAQWNGTHP